MVRPTKAKQLPARRRAATRASILAHALTDRAVRQKGFVQTEIVAKWRHIVGGELARHSVPLKLTFPRGQRMGATLFVRCESAYAPIIQHQELRITDLVNGFFGYAAVARVAITQGPLPQSNVRRIRGVRPLTPDENRRLDGLTRGRSDKSELADALRRLGQQVIGASKDTVS